MQMLTNQPMREWPELTGVNPVLFLILYIYIQWRFYIHSHTDDVVIHAGDRWRCLEVSCSGTPRHSGAGDRTSILRLQVNLLYLMSKADSVEPTSSEPTLVKTVSFDQNPHWLKPVLLSVGRWGSVTYGDETPVALQEVPKWTDKCHGRDLGELPLCPA